MESTPAKSLSILNDHSNVTIRRCYVGVVAPINRENASDVIASASDTELASPPRKRVRQQKASALTVCSASVSKISNGFPTSSSLSVSDNISSGLELSNHSNITSTEFASTLNEMTISQSSTTSVTISLRSVSSLPPLMLFSSCPIPSMAAASKLSSPVKRKLVAEISSNSENACVPQCSAKLTEFVTISTDESSTRNFQPQSSSKSPQKVSRLFPAVGSLLVSPKSSFAVANSLTSLPQLMITSDDKKPPTSSASDKLVVDDIKSSKKHSGVKPAKVPRLNMSLSWKAGASHNFHSDESAPPATKPAQMISSLSGAASLLAGGAKSRSPTRSQRRRVSFGRLQVYYFDRAQGFDTIPTTGSVALGMERRHHTMKEYSFFEFNKVNGQDQTQKCARWLAAANAEIRERSSTAGSSRDSALSSSVSATCPQLSSSAKSSISTASGPLNNNFAAAKLSTADNDVKDDAERTPNERIVTDLDDVLSIVLNTYKNDADRLVTATSSPADSELALLDEPLTDALNNNTARFKGSASKHGVVLETMVNDPVGNSSHSMEHDAADPVFETSSHSPTISNDQSTGRDVPNLDETIAYRLDSSGADDFQSTWSPFLAGYIKFSVRNADELDKEEDNVAATPPRSPVSSTYSSDEDVTDEFKQLESQFLPIRSRIRRTILRQSGVNIDTSVRDEHLSIVRSRADIGCDCAGGCQPASCACARLGVGCQVDRPPFPCACDASCENPEGRVEYDPERVHSHYLHTIMRLRIIQKRGLEDSPLSVSPQLIKFTYDDGRSGGNRFPQPAGPPLSSTAESSEA